MLNGRLAQTQQLLEAALKGFAAQADEASMLTMMGMLGLLYEQVGDRQESQTFMALLFQEWSRSPESCGGFVPWAIAREAANGSIPSDYKSDSSPDMLFLAAAERFRQESKPVWSGFVLLDRLLFDPNSIAEPEWQLWLHWLKRNVVDEPYGETLYHILSNKRATREQCSSLPARYSYLCKAVFLGEADEKPAPPLAGDIEIQIYEAAAQSKRFLADEDLRQAAVSLETMERLQKLVRTPATLRLTAELQAALKQASANVKKKENVSVEISENEQTAGTSDLRAASIPADPASSQAAEASPHIVPSQWRIKLFDGIRFYSPDGKAAEPQWKRRKAGELLVYLLLQPGYKANREQVIERVFGEGDPAKMSNQLYVTLHDLRQSLKETGMSEDPVYAKRGVIAVDEHIVGHVDAETYITLSRVGDQLWKDDREAACRLYDEALPLYGQLGTELPHAEWLDRLRDQMLDRQTIMLKRLAMYYAEIHDDSRAEQRLGEWVSLRPDQEESYETIIRHCLERGRRSEAIGWYRRLERMCVKELGTEPAEQIKRLLWT
jgi:DNA-binding SARP family transcriptional activator